MPKTITPALLAHFQSECQTRATIWALKFNYRRIDVTAITQAVNALVTTAQAHTLKVGQYVSLDFVEGMVEINDVPTGTWSFHEVLSIPTANSFTVATDTTGFTAYSAGGIVHESYGFTAHVESIKRDGLLYRANTAFTPTAINVSDKLQIPTIEMEGVLLPLLSIEGISEDDILGGRVDFAEVRTQIVNYDDLSMGGMWLGRGYVGKVTVKNDQYVAELRGLTQIASQQILELYSPGCRYDLGLQRDPRCGVDLTDPAFFKADTVTAVTANRVQFESGLADPDGFFSLGNITWTGGENSGLQMQVKDHLLLNGAVTLWQPMPFAIAVGDTFEITAGCNKTLETCRDKFDNLINHGGFPHLPGEDRLAQGLVPKRPEVTTG